MEEKQPCWGPPLGYVYQILFVHAVHFCAQTSLTDRSTKMYKLGLSANMLARVYKALGSNPSTTKINKYLKIS